MAEQDEHDLTMALDTHTLASETELAAIGLILAEKEAQRRGFVLGRAEFEEMARRFRHQNNLSKFSDVQRWMEIAQFEHDDYVKLIEDEFFLAHSRALIEKRLKNLDSRINRRRRSALALIRD